MSRSNGINIAVDWPHVKHKICGQMSEFKDRLRDERKKLGLSQQKFAVIGGVTRDTQMNYENGSRKPDSSYLEALAEAGVNVLYLLTGQISAMQLSKDEEALVTEYRNLDLRARKGVHALIDGLSMPAKTTTKYQGDVGQVVHGNQTVKAPLNLNIRTTKKKP
jgi:transcriptional regulator with XRE-family HTH domain